jgi:hypothetical protein
MGHLAILDSYVCLVHLATRVDIESVSNVFSLVAFAKFVLFSLLELRYMLLVWKAQRPDLMRGGIEQARREISAIYARFCEHYFILFFFLSIMYFEPTALIPLLLFYLLDGVLLFGIVIFYAANGIIMFILTFAMYSFWIPQIVHNVKNDCRKPLNPTYVLVSSTSRLFLPLCMILSLIFLMVPLSLGVIFVRRYLHLPRKCDWF